MESPNVAGAAQEERRGGEVVDGADAHLAADGLDAGDPQAGGFAVVLGFLALVAGQALLAASALPVTVMRLVVDDHDVFDAHQPGHHAQEHLAFGLDGAERLAGTALQQQAAGAGDLHPLAALEGVVVGDHDGRAVDVGQQLGGHQFAAAVVAVRIVRLQDAQAVLDGDAGGDDQKTAAEPAAVGMADGVDGLPGDQHGHHRGLAAAGGHLHGEAEQFRVRLGVGALDMVHELAAADAEGGGNLGEPDHGLDGFDLAEEGFLVDELVGAPVLQQAGGGRGDLPLVWVGQVSPGIHELADFVDDGRGVVFDLGGRQVVLVLQYKTALLGRRGPAALAL